VSSDEGGREKGMKKQITVLSLCAMLFAHCVSAETQQPIKIPRIGYLAVSTASAHSARMEAFRQGLRDLGYQEGQNIVIEYRFTNGNSDRLLDLAAELVRLKVDAIVTTGSEGAFAAKHATTTIPIITTTGDHLATGIIASLARPGGNITGLTNIASDLSGKQLELLKETAPRITRVCVLWNPTDPGPATVFKAMESTGRELGLQIQSLEVRDAKDFHAAFKTATEARIQALIVLGGGLTNIH
jgi:putative ABC transport system substrate-binding protein